jgi:hypothetical protein
MEMVAVSQGLSPINSYWLKFDTPPRAPAGDSAHRGYRGRQKAQDARDEPERGILAAGDVGPVERPGREP